MKAMIAGFKRPKPRRWWGSRSVTKALLSWMVAEPELAKVIEEFDMKAATDIVGSMHYCLCDTRFSLRKEHKEYGIPLGTLSHKVRGKYNNQHGRPTAISEGDELSLANHIKVVSDWWFPFDMFKRKPQSV